MTSRELKGLRVVDRQLGPCKSWINVRNPPSAEHCTGSIDLWQAKASHLLSRSADATGRAARRERRNFSSQAQRAGLLPEQAKQCKISTAEQQISGKQERDFAKWKQIAQT